MARSRRQIQNSAKIVVVAALAKEFRKSAIIEKMLEIATKKNMIAKGDLINPRKSRSLSVVADDQWLTRPDAVKVTVGPLVGVVPEYMIIQTNIPNTAKDIVSEKYYDLTQEAPKRPLNPPSSAIATWVRRKMARGSRFTIDNRPATQKDAPRLGFLIARSIRKKGVNKTNFANPIKYRKTGVDATRERGINKAMERLSELYGTLVFEEVDTTMQNIL